MMYRGRNKLWDRFCKRHWDAYLPLRSGYVLKRLGFFQAKEKRPSKKITLNITLPAAVITSFAGFQPEAQLYLLILLGLGANLLFLAMGMLLGRNKDEATKVFYMNNCPGYNIGAFTMPFVQNFLGAFGMVVTCLFDMGNSVMCTGGTYALTSAKTGESKTSARRWQRQCFLPLRLTSIVL